MTITTLTSREFNQDTAKAKRAAADGPVFITDRGKPAHVLLSIDEYNRLTGRPPDIRDLLAMPAEFVKYADREFDIPRSREPGRFAEFD
jgi:prevent-host-death family protein